MRSLHNHLRAFILNFVDIFYPLFRRFMPIQTYRYAACGGGNTAFSLLLYFASYNFILDKRVIDLGFIALKPHIAALFLSFLISFPIGFYLSMYVVFSGSPLRKKTQLFRYFLVVLGCVVINYAGLKLFVEVLGWYPTPSQVVNTAIVISFSYVSQRHFSFRAPATTK